MRMPAEWEKHSRTFVAFPHAGYTLGESEADVIAALKAWSNVANQASDFESVSVVVHPQDLKIAGNYLSKQIDLIEIEIDDAWIRDSGPTFAFDGKELVAIDWVFNGWGAQSWASFQQDALLAKRLSERLGIRSVSSELVNEGGGIHVDGKGRVLLTETVQLGRERNPNWSKAAVEDEIHQKLGTTEAIWLKRGLTRDYDEFGTKGHVDIVACFAPDGRVLYHEQRDPSHPDYQVSREVRQTLIDHRLEVVAVPAPEILRDKHGYVDYSYINHYVLNDGVLLCSFEDKVDKEVQAMLKEIYPGREIRLLDARELFARGGGIHCITQQQPAA
jgi:agmatine deiminase